MNATATLSTFNPNREFTMQPTNSAGLPIISAHGCLLIARYRKVVQRLYARNVDVAVDVATSGSRGFKEEGLPGLIGAVSAACAWLYEVPGGHDDWRAARNLPRTTPGPGNRAATPRMTSCQEQGKKSKSR